MGIFEKSDAARKEKENLKREKQELIRLKKEYAENEKTIARLQKKLDKKEKEHFALQTREIKRRIERAPAPDESLWEVDGSGALRSKEGASLPEEVTIPQKVAGRPVTAAGSVCGTGVRRVAVPEGVRELKAFCFAECAALEEVVLPPSLRVIGENAFWSCASLRTILLPEGLEEIRMGAFARCAGLEKISFPPSLRTIGINAFLLCENLREVRFSRGLKVIGELAFSECGAIEEVWLPDSLEMIGYGAFSCLLVSCGPRRFVFPRSWKGREEEIEDIVSLYSTVEFL